jgi:hypothetical protein
MGTVQHGDLIGYYSVTGTKMPVVLLHAGASSGAQWKTWTLSGRSVPDHHA